METQSGRDGSGVPDSSRGTSGTVDLFVETQSGRDGSGVPDSSRGISGTVDVMWRHNQAVMGLVYLTVQEEPRVQLSLCGDTIRP